MSTVLAAKPKDCRCSSCGYIHVNEKVDPVSHEPLEPVAQPTAPVAVPPVAVVQLIVCPLCRTEFQDPAEYAAHRERNCAPAPIADPPVADPPQDPAPADPAPNPEG